MTKYLIELDGGIAVTLVEKLERYDIVGYSANGGGTATQNVWFLQDNYSVPPRVIMDTPYTFQRDAQFARANLILEELFNMYGDITDDQAADSE